MSNTKKKQTRLEYLQELLEDLVGHDPVEEYYIQYRGRAGWFQVGPPVGWLEDDGGDFLGHTWQEAEKEIRGMWGDQPNIWGELS